MENERKKKHMDSFSIEIASLFRMQSPNKSKMSGNK